MTRIGWGLPFLLLLLLLVPFRASAADPEVVDVFVPESDGFKSIRIPAVVVAKQGVVLAFAEGRAANVDQAKNKIVLTRSADGGKTWGKVAVIADDGDRSLNNPCAVVEREPGQALVMFQPDALVLMLRLFSACSGIRENSDRSGHGILTNSATKSRNATSKRASEVSTRRDGFAPSLARRASVRDE